MTSSVRSDPAKPALRRAARYRRSALGPGRRAAVDQSIAQVALELPALRRAACVAVYASLPDEPGTELLRAGLHELGIRVLLPIAGTAGSTGADPTEADEESGGTTKNATGQHVHGAQTLDRTLDWAVDDGELAAAGPLRLPEPRGPRLGPAAIATAEVVIVPALAVDTTGTRLGRGRAYYDLALALADPQALTLALVHDHELMDAASTPIPRESHDVPVRGVLTPTRWMFFRPAPGLR